MCEMGLHELCEMGLHELCEMGLHELCEMGLHELCEMGLRKLCDVELRSFVVPAKAGTQWRVRAKDAGFPLPRERRCFANWHGVPSCPISAGCCRRCLYARNDAASVHA
jgi:hypothetical protein